MSDLVRRQQRRLSDETVAQLAAELHRRERPAQPGPRLQEQVGKWTLADAYTVQERYVVADRLTAGARIVGRKVGATNPTTCCFSSSLQ